MNSTTQMASAFCQFKPAYLSTTQGIIKCVCMVLNLIGLICISASKYHSKAGSYFHIVAVIGLIFTGIMLTLYLLNIVERVTSVPWLLLELAYYTLWTLLYLIAAILVAETHQGAYVAGAVFGFMAMVTYGVGAWTLIFAIRSGVGTTITEPEDYNAML